MIKILFTLLIGYCIALILVFFAQRALLYFPTPAKNSGEQITIPVDDQHEIKVQVHDTEKSDAIIYFGGNAEDATYSAEIMRPMFEGYAQYYLHYPGYGGSSGKPTEQSLYKAAEQLYEFVTLRHQNITLVGRSLGTGVATYIAAKREVHKLILVTPFDSITEVASHHYPFLPVKWLIKDTFDSISRAAQISAQTLLISAQNDEVIPAHLSERLFREWHAERARYTSIENTDHNNIHLHPAFESAVVGFLREKRAVTMLAQL